MKRLQAHAPAQNSLTAAVLWMITTVLVAQETAQGPHARLLVLNSREASRLIVDQVRPEYPPLAKVNYIQGPVRIQLLVARGGRVAEAHVIRGHPFLAAEALKAVFAAARKNLEHLKFQPARWGNHPVPWYIDLEVPVEGIPAVQHTASPIGSYVHSAPREEFVLQRRA